MRFYLLSVPIGHLEDTSFHFLKTVSDLDYLAGEDSREVSKLLRLLQAKFPQYRLWPKKIIRTYQEKERGAGEEILNLLKKGTPVGLLTDAGTPGISDPGAFVVNQVRSAGIPVEIVPGPSALTAALSVCGFEANVSVFIGFVPKKPLPLLLSLQKLVETKNVRSLNMVFFESPYRIRKTVQLLFSLMPHSQIFLGREMTKKFQELIWIDQQNYQPAQLKEKGEYTGVLNLRML